MADGFKDFERFVYKEHEGIDISPRHGIWDAALNTWARDICTFGTKRDAEIYAAGMNQFREMSRQPERAAEDAISSLERTLESLRRYVA